MTRVVLGALIGYVAWTLLWLGGNVAVFPTAGDGTPVNSPGLLLGLLVLSVVCSLIAGRIAVTIARERAGVSVLALAALLLLTGIGVEASVWTLMPVWYHAIFLALLAPVTMVGGRRQRVIA